MKCTRCGKENPASIHTCTPLALRLAEILDRSVLAVSADAATELRRLHAENEALRADAERYRWMKQEVKRIPFGWEMIGWDAAIDGMRERLGEKT